MAHEVTNQDSDPARASCLVRPTDDFSSAGGKIMSNKIRRKMELQGDEKRKLPVFRDPEDLEDLAANYL